jgi:hypothetical protein
VLDLGASLGCEPGRNYAGRNPHEVYQGRPPIRTVPRRGERQLNIREQTKGGLVIAGQLLGSLQPVTQKRPLVNSFLRAGASSRPVKRTSEFARLMTDIIDRLLRAQEKSFSTARIGQ